MITAVALQFATELLRDIPPWWGRGAVAVAVLTISFVAVMANLR